MAAEAELYPLYPLAVAIPILTGLVVLLDIPPLYWHIRHHNVGTGSVILYIMILNSIGFINALIWPRDNFMDWFDGNILCDIEVRLHLFTSFGIGASLVCIFKSLANVLDTRNCGASLSRESKRRKLIRDLLLCVGTPLLFIVVYYAVQPQRYAIQSISGCAFTWDGTWVGIVLCIMWFPLLQTIAALYAGIVIFRLIRYSRMFSEMLQNHNSTRSRFYRTLAISLFLILCNLPLMLYSFVLRFPLLGAYSWDYTHSDWNTIAMIPTQGRVNYDIWGSLAGSVMVFIFFGIGQEPLKVYRGWLVTLGLGRIWPSLLQEPSRQGSSSNDRWSLLEKRARKLFGKRMSEDYTDTASGTAWSSTDPEIALPAPVAKCVSPVLLTIELEHHPFNHDEEAPPGHTMDTIPEHRKSVPFQHA